MERLTIGPGTTLSVVAHDAGRLEVEASYEPGGAEPPAHLHPSQEERFELVSGAMRTRIGGHEGELRPGDELEIPAGTVHQMWNASGGVTVMRWTTMPAGRTLDWFRELAAAVAGAPKGDPATLLDRYADVFRLA
jgi:mannose-6-phosphate isomerase-like protein (cupin superfamily)